MRQSLFVLSLGLFVHLSMTPSTADELAVSLAKLHKESEGRVVPVEFTARVTIEGLPGINTADNERNLRGTACGVVIEKGKGKQYVVVPTSSLAPGARVFEILGASARIRWSRFAVDTGGGVKVGASVVNVDPDLGLSLLMLDKASDVLKPLPLEKGPRASVGSQVALLHLGSRILSSPRLVSVARVAGHTDSPRTLTILDPAKAQAHGALVYEIGKNKALGLYSSLPLRTLPSESGTVGRRTFESDEVEAAMRGYVIPLEDIAQWVKNAKEKEVSSPDKGAMKQAWLGVEVQVITEELATALGLDYEGVAKVKKIYKGSPAESVGLKAGDIILELDGEALEMGEGESMRDLVGDSDLGETVQLKVLRGEKSMELKVKLTAAPPSPETVPRFPAHAHGFVFRERTLFDAGKTVSDHKGLVVSKIDPKGQAKLAGLKAQDLIVSIDGQKVDKVEQAKTLIRPSRSVTLGIRRLGQDKVMELRVQIR